MNQVDTLEFVSSYRNENERNFPPSFPMLLGAGNVGVYNWMSVCVKEV